MWVQARTRTTQIRLHGGLACMSTAWRPRWCMSPEAPTTLLWWVSPRSIHYPPTLPWPSRGREAYLSAHLANTAAKTSFVSFISPCLPGHACAPLISESTVHPTRYPCRPWKSLNSIFLVLSTFLHIWRRFGSPFRHTGQSESRSMHAEQPAKCVSLLCDEK